MKKIFTYILLLTGLMACGNEDNITNEQQPAAQAQVYHVCIPASIGDDAQTRAVSFDNTTCTSTFSTTEKVYVYNKSKSTMLTGNLSPTNLSNENKNCDLTGDLTGTFSEGDELWLLYNSDSSGNFYYTSQNGLATGVKDGAKAVVTVSATSPLTTSFAHFTNLQSMFRFKFVNESSNPIDISYLILLTANNQIGQTYWRSGVYTLGKIEVRPTPATSDYIYLGLSFHNSQTNDKMIFIATDGTNLYRTTKSEPSGGFQHGKYYYNTTPIQMANEGVLQTPTITWTAPSSPVTPSTTNYHYGINTANADISLTGTSRGYYYYFSDDATVQLNSLTAIRFEVAIIKYAKNLTLDIIGTNSFSCIDNDYCVEASQTLKLKGNGTLTVRSCKPTYCGLKGSNYTTSSNSYSTTTELDVTSQLAAPGYTVTRSARTDNGDGTYTWTYTVSPGVALANSNLGDKVCSDGKAYPVDVTLPGGVSVIGMVAYKSGASGIVLYKEDNSSTYTWENRNSGNPSAVNVYINDLSSTTSKSWTCGDRIQYTNCGVTGSAGWSSLQTHLTNAGCNGLVSGYPYYWTNTETSLTGTAWAFYDGNWDGGNESYSRHVRPLFEF